MEFGQGWCKFEPEEIFKGILVGGLPLIERLLCEVKKAGSSAAWAAEQRIEQIDAHIRKVRSRTANILRMMEERQVPEEFQIEVHLESARAVKIFMGWRVVMVLYAEGSAAPDTALLPGIALSN